MTDPNLRLFLDVESSALGRPWRPRLDIAGEQRALAIVQRHGLSDILARVLAGRGVGIDEASAYLDPTIRALMPDPSSLQDMDAAVERLARAVTNGETVAIFGDYDVDGACSAALLASFLDACGAPRLVRIPDRIFEGYGPNAEAIKELRAAGANLLVTVDCGTTSHEVLAGAKALGMDVIVLDHHQAPEILPDALVVNPNRQDDLSGLGALCAAGVVFMALVGLNRALRTMGFWTASRPAPDLLESLDLVALATVADVAPLTGLNRAFVVKGLAVLRGRGRRGLAALMDVARLVGPPQAWHLGFLLGPRINAGGRIGDAALGAKLLLTDDPAEAGRIAAELDRLNHERRAIELATVEAAQAEADLALGRSGEGAAIVVAGEDWSPGIVGLVASRLKEKFQRPAFAVALAGRTGTGSGRSIAGVDLGAAVRQAVEAGILIKGGGHAMAAGVTVAREKLGEFRAFLEQKLATKVAAAREKDALYVDSAVTAAGATRDLVHAVAAAGPFGASAPEPVFVLPRHRILNVMPVGEDHLRVSAQAADGARLDAMAFRAGASGLAETLPALSGGPAHLAVTLSLDHYGGRERVQARILDAARAD
ncbi:MAG TPA: single-stranded-DNA-specific exonuclease RecJ [Rhodoblastus sp.]|nr:single-stranded-DNA-specific exonuclease RecJ [Rhodoblastus sp.]